MTIDARSRLPVERPLREPREVLLRQMVAAVRDEDARAPSEERRQVDRRLLAGRREPDQDDRAARRDHAECLLERLRTADDVEDEVDRPGLGVRRAEPRRLLELLAASMSIARISDAPAMRAPWITESPTAPQPITPTRAPSQTCAVSSTLITPVATAQPIRHACSAGSSCGIFTAATAGTTVRVANVPVRRTGDRTLAVGAMQPPRRSGRLLALARSAARARCARAARGVPAEHDPIAFGETLDVLADTLDGTGSFVPEQHRQLMPPAVLLDHVEVAVADAGRVDPDAHLARAGLVDADLLERDLTGRGEDYTLVSHERSRSRTECPPASAS